MFLYCPLPCFLFTVSLVFLLFLKKCITRLWKRLFFIIKTDNCPLINSIVLFKFISISNDSHSILLLKLTSIIQDFCTRKSAKLKLFFNVSFIFHFISHFIYPSFGSKNISITSYLSLYNLSLWTCEKWASCLGPNCENQTRPGKVSLLLWL